MDVLVPVDDSDCSFRALGFGADMAARYDADLHVVHFADEESNATDAVVERAQRVLDARDADADPEVSTNVDIDVDVRSGGRAGSEILDLVDERGYDHVVMGHHGAGTIERAILGSAAETVLRSEKVPVTVIP
ncbi:universal stress protein [Halobacterium jilantaiense]|uniref:Nucleotide-binding universal stress protein, UspA family n=1 Tax=Halobacterium jilantaiense TaxID=355548 RepID=A0A1I0PR43_9EURY|nr:universal stress protein [Halobacterium jilantaiense]SEW16773.1 Nucleotide-binding universal stress protein, UspA family [Halobacterium jilantaiense]